MSTGSNDESKPSGDKPDAATAPAKAAKVASDTRVIRDESGVIVGARGAGPKILGVISLPTRRKSSKASPKPATKGAPRGQRRGSSVQIVNEQGNEGPKGRASARKAREVKSVRRPLRRPLRRSGKPSSSGTEEMSADKKRIRVDENISIGDLARQMGVKGPKVIRVLWGIGVRNATVNSKVDLETAELLAAEFGYRIDDVSFDEAELIEAEAGQEPEGELRAPVLTVLGHVDHGKTTLLDRLRGATVAEGEAGGITQHVGAYRVQTPAGPMVLVDTPGHAAFTAMRERGAQLTDIVILLVAADDGVMPTTIEAIAHTKAAQVPIIVAVNKCELPTADVPKVERQLMEHGILSDTYGGETPIVAISAKTGEGVEELLEQVGALAELLELRAPIEGRASGVVLESRVDRGRGVIVTILIQAGTLSRGDIAVAAESSGRVSAIVPMGESAAGEATTDDKPKKKKKDKAKAKPKKKKKDKPRPTATVQSSGPASVVEIAGFDEAPPVGVRFHVVEDDKAAKQLVSHRREQRRRIEGSQANAPSFADRLAAERQAARPTIALVIRADVQGSLEAVEQVVKGIETEKVATKILAMGVGEITEGDVKLAASARLAGSKVVPSLFGFGVKAGSKVAALAENEGISIHTSKVIYELGDQLEVLMLDQLEPTYLEHPLGKAEIRKLFPTSVGVVCGCRVLDGKITRASGIRVMRGDQIISETKIASLRIVERDVKEVGTDQECGIFLVDSRDLEEGDLLHAFELEAIAPTLR